MYLDIAKELLNAYEIIHSLEENLDKEYEFPCPLNEFIFLKALFEVQEKEKEEKANGQA
jgi:transcriptional regulatory protein LevR